MVRRVNGWTRVGVDYRAGIIRNLFRSSSVFTTVWDGTMQSTSVLQTSGRRALQGKTFSVGDCRGLFGTAEDCGVGQSPSSSITGDCGELPVTTGDYESYQQHFSWHPSRTNIEIHLIRLKETWGNLVEINRCRIYPIAYSPTSFFLSYTSTRIHALSIP